MEHIVLLGDSVFDNKVYVGLEPSVSEHLLAMIPSGWNATLCAVDGDTTQGIARHVEGAPMSATYLFVSVGGNDALMNLNMLSDLTESGPALLETLSQVAAGFRSDYRRAIDAALALEKPVCVCTIYNGNLEPSIAPAARAAVAVFNDVIYATANEKHLGVIELRSICHQASDYANPIEPSASGGYKIAKAIYEQVSRTQRDQSDVAARE